MAKVTKVSNIRTVPRFVISERKHVKATKSDVISREPVRADRWELVCRTLNVV